VKSVEPWGDPLRASILVIGQDPRLQKSGATAKHAFFFEYLDEPVPTHGPARAKYALAKAVVDCELVGWARDRQRTTVCDQPMQHISGSHARLWNSADSHVESGRRYCRHSPSRCTRSARLCATTAFAWLHPGLGPNNSRS
jgi:hypothetical protein